MVHPGRRPSHRRPGAAVCPGDCDGSGTVTVDEIVHAVRPVLGESVDCGAADADLDGAVAIDDLTAAVGAILSGG